MKQDEMIVMLRRVIKENQNYTTWTVSTPHLMQLVNNAIELEREACAKIADEYAKGLERNYSEIIADEIRARGQE